MTDFNRDDFQVLQVESLYDGFFGMQRFTLKHRLFKGGWSETLTRECFNQGDASAVVLYDPVKDVVLLGSQFRVGAIREKSPWLFEVVAGKIEQGEAPDEVALRESEEEMNASIKQLITLFDFYASPGGTNEKVYYYCGIVDSENMEGIGGLANENEEIKVTPYALDDALAMVNDNLIKDAVGIIGIQWLVLNRDKLKAHA